MKQLKQRTLFVLLFILLLCGGLVFFSVSYLLHGAEWAAFRARTNLYSDGTLEAGGIYDRNGVTLYDCASGSYNDDAELRRATLHAIGDKQGNVTTGAKFLFSEYMIGFSPVFGSSGTGNKINLTLDAELNRTAYEALSGRSGTVALYNYKTGEILCMVSAPTFDPMDTDLETAIANGEVEGYDGAFLNRFLRSTYTPGSTFKLVTAAAALETLGDMSDFSYKCSGSQSYEGTDDDITCPRSHGSLNFGTALSNSCNGAFGVMSNSVGGKKLQQYAEMAGLLDSVEISGTRSAVGAFSVAKAKVDEGWSGVGQFNDLVNPAAELTLMGCIAGEGEAAVPRLLGSVTRPQLGLSAAHVDTETTSIGWKSSTCATLKSMMRDNVTDHYGQSQFGELPVCAKSGTAEVGGGQSPHAWFVGFVDSEEYPYAFVVLIENGGWGSSEAGSVAAKVLARACQ